MRAIRRFQVRPVLPPTLRALIPLSQNLRWSWHAPTRELFEALDPEAWAASHGNPMVVLSSVSRARLAELEADATFVERVQAAERDLDAYLTQDRWYQRDLTDEEVTGRRPSAIAYFSAEYGITAALPQYSGGLGILAGDHLKTASDYGVPIVGVGLFYDSGYFRQSLSRDGRQRETYPVIDPDDLPMQLLREEDGEPVVITLPLPHGRTLNAHVHLVQVGRVPLLLLDSNIRANDEDARRVTDRLYGGSPDHRLRQELLLGMGGVKALRAWSRLTGAPAPEVFHCNEGHAGFLSVERMAEIVAAEGVGVDVALEAVRAGTVFTTHTPVPAGIDRFARSLVEQYLGGECARAGVPVEAVLALGAEDFAGGNPDVFNMAVLGLRTAKHANGVARLHGSVSRGMFHQLWPGFDVEEVPITHVTNGVHGPTWTDDALTDLVAQRFPDEVAPSGELWRVGADEGGIPAAELWDFRNAARGRLVEATRRRVRSSWLERGASPAELGWTGDVLDPEVLTIGFARRVPTYKRLTLMLSDPERLTRLLTDPERPVQIVVAGKSHPDDEQGVRLIQQLVQFADGTDVRRRIVFLPDYDIALAQELMPGCDVWLNNPLRPLEASGTSGMKCALNGGLNLSVLDGWWDEMYGRDFGWAIPTADGVEDPAQRDAIEADALYGLIEHTVVPMFYDRSEDGVPHLWLDMVRATLADLAPRVQASRMLRDYVAELYAPAAAAARVLDADGHEAARELADWKARMRANWPSVRVDHVDSEGVSDGVRVGDELTVTAYVNLGTRITPKDVEVQVAFGRAGDDDVLREPEVHALRLAREFSEDRYSFTGTLKLETAGSVGYAVRVVPTHEGLAGVTELGLAANAEHAL